MTEETGKLIDDIKWIARNFNKITDDNLEMQYHIKSDGDYSGVIVDLLNHELRILHSLSASGNSETKQFTMWMKSMMEKMTKEEIETKMPAK